MKKFNTIFENRILECFFIETCEKNKLFETLMEGELRLFFVVVIMDLLNSLYL